MHPLIADGGEMTVLRDLAAFSYGRWSVDWPESVPDEQRPELPDDRDFGYASKLKRDPGRFGRRFVRADVTIKAQDFDDAGKPIPFSGESDVEETLDDAARRTDGDVFFEREITRAGLGALVPRVDFDVDSVVPVLIWGKTIPSPVTSIEDVVESGAVVDYRVHVGGQLLQDDAARERANREVEATIAQERRERVKADSKERKARRAAVSAESDARRADVESVRGVLTGGGGAQADLVASLAGLNRQLQGGGEEPAPGLIPAYLQMNTRLWEVQEETNKALRRSDEALQAGQDANSELIKFTSELAETNSDLLKAQSEVLKLLQLSNHGSWYLSDSYVLDGTNWLVMNFDKQRGTVRGCHSIPLGRGTGIEIDQPGDWEFRLRLALPPGDALFSTNTGINITVMPKGGGKSIDRAITVSSNKGSTETLNCSLVVTIPNAGCYAYAQAYASSKSGATSWWTAGTGPELTEFTARQISF